VRTAATPAKLDRAMATVRCAECKREVPAEEPGAERLPCPDCGSLAREHAVSAHSTVHVESSVSATVERGVNEARMAALLAIFAIAVSAGIQEGYASGAWGGLIAFTATLLLTGALATLVYRVPRVRHLVMDAMHRITGQ
jgi:predicted RNA-binding Zn-ribbon protein involved in translation (DUF1610 family)